MSALGPATHRSILLCLCGLGVIGLNPGDLVAAPYLATVNGSEVKIRTGGSQNHFAFSAVRMGQRIIVDREANGWCKIYIPRWIPVYVHQEYVTVTGTRAVVKAGELNIRVVPQKAHEVVGSLPLGTEIEVLAKEGDWYKIVPPATAFAYISQRYVVKEREISPADVNRQLALLTSDSVSSAKPSVALARGKDGGAAAVPASGSSAGASRAGSAFTTPALRKAEEMLQRLTSQDPLVRDYGPVKAAYEDVVKSSEDRTEIAVASDGLKRVGQLEERQAALISAQQSIAETERKNQELEAQARQVRASARGGLRSLDSDPYLARGWLTGMARFNGHPGTHRLMKGSQVLYFLQGEEGKAIPLDAYLNKRVGIKGVIKELEPKFGANLIVVSEISVLADR